MLRLLQIVPNSLLGSRRYGLLPGALERLRHETLLDGVGRHADIANFAIDHSLHTLQVREETALRDRGHVGTDTAFFLGLT